MIEYMLTTIDNPFNPFEQFVQWFLYDVEKGYNSCDLLARISETTSDMSQKEQIQENNRAIDSIIEHDDASIYKRVSPDSFES